MTVLPLFPRRRPRWRPPMISATDHATEVSRTWTVAFDTGRRIERRRCVEWLCGRARAIRADAEVPGVDPDVARQRRWLAHELDTCARDLGDSL